MAEKRKDDSTVARIAGNIAAGLVLHPSGYDTEQIAQLTVAIARAIVTEVERTKPVAALDRSQEAGTPKS